MSEHERETEFLKQCLRYNQSAGSRELEQVITRIQCDMRCVRRAAWLMAVLTALAVASLAYLAILVQNFTYNVPQFIVNLICSIGAGALVCLLTFVGLEMVYRKKQNQRREEGRQIVRGLLESCAGKPASPEKRFPGSVVP